MEHHPSIIRVRLAPAKRRSALRIMIIDPRLAATAPRAIGDTLRALDIFAYFGVARHSFRMIGRRALRFDLCEDRPWRGNG